jgi:hypothetical protein
VLEAAGWRITVDSHAGTYRLTDRLESDGGYGLTHTGTLKRADGTLFDADDADEALWALRHFLSFARGFWSGPVLPVGVNAGGESAWERWDLRKLSRWEHVTGWFDADYGQLLEAAFAGFMPRWATSEWQRPLQSAIYWYVHSNTMAGGLDGSIVLSQAALELLAWVLLVKDRKALSGNKFKDLSATDQVRQLLTALGIPLAIPAACRALTVEAPRQEPGWTDGPQACASVRNGTVHPNLTRREQYTPDLLFDVWNLQLWYIELVLLAVSGYTGPYANRLRLPRHRGVVEPVPWAGPDRV